MKIYLKKHYYSLVPCDDESLEALKKLKADKTYYLDVKVARNYLFHRKFFSLLKYGFDNQDRYDDFTSFRYEVIMRAGFYKTHITIKGKTLFIPDSIAFDKMPAEEFEKLYDKAIDVILKHFIDDTKEHVEEVLSYVG